MKKVYPVKVVWVDSVGHAGWHAASEVRTATRDVSRCTTIGFLLEKSKKRLTLAMSLVEDQQEVHHLLTIPRVAVVSVEKL